MTAAAATVSVVIPARNAARTLAETLRSVLGQSLPPLEVIVADDGSEDATAACAAAAGVQVLSLPRGGASRATNRGVAAARGRLLAFCDADDLWLPRKLESQVPLLAAGDGMVAALCQVEAFACPSLAPEQARRIALPAGPQPGWMRSSLLLPRDAFDRVGPLDESLVMGDMIDWFDRARRAGVAFAIHPDTLVRRRLHPASLSHAAGGGHGGYVEMARRALARRRQGPG